MSVSSKSSSAQSLRLMLYNRPLHPELFPLEMRRTDRHGDYEVELWLFPAGHVARFQAFGDVMCETVIEMGDHLPETGLVHALPCLGEKDYELPNPPGRIGYVTTIQTEQLTVNLFTATKKEMIDYAQETGGLSHLWHDADGQECLSVLDFQKYKRELHIQSYHMLASTGSVLRTQSIFEIRE